MDRLVAGDLVLEPLTVAHADAMFDVLSDPDIYRHLDHGPPPSVAHLREVYAKLETRRSPDGRQLWLNWVVRGSTGEALGYVQATLTAPGAAWIAYVFASRYWGAGHARVATQAMLHHLDHGHGVVRFFATVEAANARSIALLERLAFERASADRAEAQHLAPTEVLFVHGVPA